MPEFLPRLPLELPQAAVFAALLAVGLLAGEAARRYLALPRITGYVVVGALLGPHVSGLLDADTLFELRLLVDLSIGLIVFELGMRLNLAWLLRNRWLFLTALAESLFSFACIYAALVHFGFPPLQAGMAAAIGTATSPAVVMLVAHELRAEGQVTERMLLFTAVNCVMAYVALTLMLPFLHREQSVAWPQALAHPVYLLLASGSLGFAASLGLLWAVRWLGKSEERQFVLLIAMVVIAVGLAHGLRLSVMLTLLTFGMLARNLDRRHALLPLRPGHGAQLFYVILFVLTGASLDFGAVLTVSPLVVATFIGARFLGKALPLLLFGRLSAIRPGGAGQLALALLPMSGLAVVMVQDTVSLYPSFGRELAAVVLASVVLLELAGPLSVQFALRSAKEAHPDG